MKVLVTAASKHGATHGIAEHLAKTLIDHDLGVDLVEPGAVSNLAGYDAVLLGSAVYAGNWMKDAKDLVTRLGSELIERPVWLFSSGPTGEAENRKEMPLPQLEELMAETGARAHQWFAGKLDKTELSMAERAIVKVVKAPMGDFREWDEITGWAEEIASTLAHP